MTGIHTKKTTRKYWLLFLLSVIAFFVVYAIGGGWSSMVLPFVGTSLALALNLI